MKKIERTKELILEDIRKMCREDFGREITQEELDKFYLESLSVYDLQQCRDCGDLFPLSGEDFCAPCRWEAALTYSSDAMLAQQLEQRNRWN